MQNPFSFQCPDTEMGYAITHLQHKVENPDIPPGSFYSRYWFGSAAVCRLLLLTMEYQDIKWLLWIASTLLLMIFAVRIVNRAGWIKSLPIFLSLLFANFFVVQFSIQLFPVMAIALIGGTWMCKNGVKQRKKISMFLFVIGMFTAYFDLLTTPLLTLGLPLIVYMILQGEEKKPAREILKSIFILCLFWFIGYASAWAIKWILATLADPASIDKAIAAIKWRTEAENYTRWDAIVCNFNLIPLVWLRIILIPLFLLTVISFNKKGISLSILFLMVGLFPYIWYFILSSHSYPHWWFTYRLQIISMCCVMSAFVSLTDWERLKFKIKRIKLKK
jgi:hypothetical protein